MYRLAGDILHYVQILLEVSSVTLLDDIISHCKRHSTVQHDEISNMHLQNYRSKINYVWPACKQMTFERNKTS